ncbi:zinc-binding dehydrogenase [Pedosphaera parvula]|uniref:Alcohol dehydrogenase zinc-binding domain protein n=1 Tax=Pedosphaera parvula (strain Ellin514) TaxID=320771 RepID=B9XIS6_PEDPL|nr:zinc-binding dehydrogenase [Pedosphaera parvula]EEF60339.1 Alcohol dehydrogenase zinc-binding domain protein [Pedosphaera parvula Ellin514]
MEAFQLIAHGAPGKFELREVPEPKPAPDEVLVQVQSCGLNHLDLWLEEGALPVPVALPRTPGGEIAGRILEIGASVEDWKPGDRVAVQSNLFCGECEFCRKGEESLCLKGELLGVQRDGGFAEKVVVPVRALVRLPESADFDASAALTLAGSTAMHMLTNRTAVHPNDWVLVMGASSGVGSAAIQIAKGLGARVVTTASTEAKRVLGKQLGADHVVDSNDPNWPAEVRKITEKRGVDVAVEHIGGEVLPKVFECLARGGTVVTCGATAGRDVTINLWPFFVKQQRLIGSYGRNKADIEATLKWVAAGKLIPVIDSIYPLDETDDAFAHLRSRNVLGKVLIEPYEPISRAGAMA